MTAAYFLGSALHTALGPDLASCLAALKQRPAAPARIPSSLDANTSTLPYFLLHGLPADATRERSEERLFQVAEQALRESQLDARQRRRAGLFLGSSSFDIASEEVRYARELATSPAAFPMTECGMGNLAAKMRSRLGLRGEDYTFNTACTSSANALWYAAKMVEQGLIDHALVVGVELINTTTTYGFQALQLLSPNEMRPFDAQRNGLVLGESISAMVVGPKKGRTGFYLRGGANNCDTFSMSTTREDGTAVKEVIGQALHDARIDKGAIAAIKCHGTASLSGDAAEANGMLATFKELPPCVTLKPFIGHTLGACGLSELILFCKAVESGFLPGTPGLAVDGSAVGIRLTQAPTPIENGHFMLNYFGFGGNNTSLIVSNVDHGEQR